MAYKYSEYGSSYPGLRSYHDNTGYYTPSQKEMGARANNFEPMRVYSGEIERAQRPQMFNWHVFRTAFASAFFCVCCGMVGLMYSLLSYVDHSKGDIHGYRQKKNCALGWSIAALVLGSLIMIGWIVGTSLLLASVFDISSISRQYWG